jgi:hypothetical protein
LPAPVVAFVQDGALLLRFTDGNVMTLAREDITQVNIPGSWFGWGYETATILWCDPYGVVPTFRITLASDHKYWISAFAKIITDKLGISIVDRTKECPF